MLRERLKKKKSGPLGFFENIKFGGTVGSGGPDPRRLRRPGGARRRRQEGVAGGGGGDAAPLAADDVVHGNSAGGRREELRHDDRVVRLAHLNRSIPLVFCFSYGDHRQFPETKEKKRTGLEFHFIPVLTHETRDWNKLSTPKNQRSAVFF